MGIIIILGRIFVVGVVLFFAYMIFMIHHVEKLGCSRVLEIAKNTSKVSYLDDWATKHIIDQGFYYASGMHGRVHGFKGEEHYNILPLPSPEISGIPHEFLRFSIYKSDAEFKDEITTENVKQLDFGYGRDQIILLKNGAELSEYRGTGIPSKKIVKVNSTTYAYCADSKF